MVEWRAEDWKGEETVRHIGRQAVTAVLALLAFFVMAALVDFLSVEWHGARERGKLLTLGFISGLIEVLNWIPLYVAITQEKAVWALAADFGSVVGSMLGGYRETKKQKAASNDAKEIRECKHKRRRRRHRARKVPKSGCSTMDLDFTNDSRVCL